MELDERVFGHGLVADSPSKADGGPEAQASAAGHLVPLPGGGESVWRWVGLRGAGFPAEQVLALACGRAAASADELIGAEHEAQAQTGRALSSVVAALDALRGAGLWDDEERRVPLVRALRSLKSGKLPAAAQADESAAAEVETLRGARAKVDAARAAYAEAFADDGVRLTRSLREVAASKSFREAVVWQNPHAFRTAIVPLLSRPQEEGGSKRRRYAEMVATYLQRYCVKNDTIGFFGPVGWAKFVERGEALDARPGASLVAERNVYFETWCMEALAEKLSLNPALRPWFLPRRMPYLHLEGTTLHVPRSRPFTLPRPLAAAVRLCDGTRTAREIALTLCSAFPAQLEGEEDGYALLEQLRSRGLILWKLELPVELSADRALRIGIERIGDEAMRAEALSGLDELERGRTAVARAAGDAERLDGAMANLEESFTRISGMSPTRAGGKMYAARTLVYEDCRRDLEVDVGQDVLNALGPPLSLLLESARWFTFQVAEFYRETFGRIYAELSAQAGSREVDCATFWYRTLSTVMDSDKNGAAAVLPEFRRRWEEILSLPQGHRRVSFTTEQLRPLVRERFDAPRAGWSAACYHSPDVMIAARDVEAVRRGDYELVLGEFHLGVNTLRGAMFVAQHPRPEELFRAVEADWPADGVRITPPKNMPGMTARTTPVLLPRNNPRVLITQDAVRVPGAGEVLEVGSFVVVESGGRLLVRSRDGRLSRDIIEAFSDSFQIQMVNKFRMTGQRAHTPRVSVDRLVVLRESWACAPSDLGFAYVRDDAERFLAARHWARERGAPRFVFAKSPFEKKPVYVDFDSPVYVDIFARVIRQTAEQDDSGLPIVVSEMLPAHADLWLPDAEGRRYTSELRIVAVCH